MNHCFAKNVLFSSILIICNDKPDLKLMHLGSTEEMMKVRFYELLV